MRITYSVGARPPSEHRIEVALRLSGVAPGTIDVVFPSWVPGSYTIRPIARNVRGAEGSSLP